VGSRPALKRGANIERVFKPERREQVNGHWDQLPRHVAGLGDKPEELLAGWEAVKNKVGADEMDKIPFGAIAMYNYADKLACGLQQFMAGARKFQLLEITRDDLMAANPETAEANGIPFMCDAQDEATLSILEK
jgi:hypothetical protein